MNHTQNLMVIPQIAATVKKTLRVGVVIRSQFVEPCVLKNYKKCRYPGVSFQLFQFVARLLGYTDLKIIKYPVDRSVGINGSLGGLVGMLANKTIDVTGSLLTINDDIEELRSIDYCIPVGTAPTGMVMVEDVRDSSQWIFSVLEPFQTDVWLYLLGFTIIINILIHSYRYLKRSKNAPRIDDSVRIFMLTKAFLFMFLFFRSYKSNLYTVFVAKAKPKFPFDSLESFANAFVDNQIQLSMYNGSSLSYDISRSTLDPWIRVNNHIQNNPGTLISFGDDRRMIQAVAATPSLAFRITQMSFLAKTLEFCNLTFTEIATSYLAFAFQKHSKLAEEFSSVLYSRGHSSEDWDNVLLGRMIPQKRCGAKPKRPVKRFRKLDLEKMRGSFAFLIGGACASAIILLIELLFGRLFTTRSRRQSELSNLLPRSN